MRAAASDMPPAFGSSAIVCIPAAIFMALASRWIIGRILRDADRKTARSSEEAPTSSSISTKSPDSP
jgi:hypothetical protein